ncbi:MAG: hypothetical protein K2Y18_00505 [Alphaproteobacteria bacterium]|jgi:hypothetical protein|nr:hypothetical protein [Alphaproteobacteria bacterium]
MMSIQELAQRYNQFQHDFGQGVSHDYEKVINTLFSQNFKKIANGIELLPERAQLLPQLNGVKDFAGTWAIQSQEIIPSFDNMKCTIRYSLKSEKAGEFDVIAILKAHQGQIEQIDEIYYQPGN